MAPVIQQSKTMAKLSEEKQELLDMLATAKNLIEVEETIEALCRLPERKAELEQQTGASTRRKDDGVYYTNLKLAKEMIALCDLEYSPNKTFLEPACGGGVFFFAYLLETLSHPHFRPEDTTTILSSCFLADIDSYAVENILEITPVFIKRFIGVDASLPISNVFVGDSLLDVKPSGNVVIRDLKAQFAQNHGFDFVVTNPPYRLLKKDGRDDPTSHRHVTQLARLVNKSKDFHYQFGVGNTYKLFVEAMFEQWVRRDGTCGFLVPKSLLSGQSTWGIRRRLLENSTLSPITWLDEGNDSFAGVGQAFVMFTARLGKSTEVISFGEGNPKGLCRRPVSISVFEKATPFGSIFPASEQQLSTLEAFARTKRFNQLAWAKNWRGEFDITFDRDFEGKSRNGRPLVTGRDVARYELRAPNRFVSQDYEPGPKSRFISSPRIVCQQISNSNQDIRLKWSFVPAGYVVANSCNFISIQEGSESLDRLWYLLGVLNSRVVNEFFKLTSSNNHISNSEIDNLPVGEFGAPLSREIARLAMILQNEYSPGTDENLEHLVRTQLGIRKD